MTIGVGVIGAGSIGGDHIRRLSSQVSGSSVEAVFDIDRDRACSIADSVGAVAHNGPLDVVASSSVDAVLIATPGETHAELTRACIEAGKPVLCEKPLAPTIGECLSVLDAEVAFGSRLVRVGFMRRYDSGYEIVKKTIEEGGVGEVLLIHCLHRNATASHTFTSSMSFTDSVIHEIDTSRWLIDDELIAATVVGVRHSPLAPPHLRDPQLVLFESASGIVVEVEVFVNCQYGYDVRCEVVGSHGTVSLELPTSVTTNRSGWRGQDVPPDWKLRFDGAYLTEIQDWVDDLSVGLVRGPSAWDGYCATAVAECCVRSLSSGVRETIELPTRPELYG